MSTTIRLDEGLELRHECGFTWLSNGSEEIDLSSRQLEVLAKALYGYVPFDLAERKREIARYETLLAGRTVCGGSM